MSAEFTNKLNAMQNPWHIGIDEPIVKESWHSYRLWAGSVAAIQSNSICVYQHTDCLLDKLRSVAEYTAVPRENGSN